MVWGQTLLWHDKRSINIYLLIPVPDPLGMPSSRPSFQSVRPWQGRISPKSGDIIGPLHPLFHQYGDRVASVIGFAVCSLFSALCTLYVCYIFLILYVTNFLILLQYDIWPADPNCNMCNPEFAAGVNRRRHDTLTRTVMNVMKIFYWEWS